MADFHAYTVTLTTKITVPADSAGNPTPFATNSIPGAVKTALVQQLLQVAPAVGTPVLTVSGATEVTVA